MPYIAGMSLGSWILIIAIAIWAFIAIKCYFFGGFKKHGDSSRPHVSSKPAAPAANACAPRKTSAACPASAPFSSRPVRRNVPVS